MEKQEKKYSPSELSVSEGLNEEDSALVEGAPFIKNETVQCSYSGILYPAKVEDVLPEFEGIDSKGGLPKIMKREHVNSEKKCVYYVHYIGWPRRWDQWVTEDRLHKLDPENLKTQKQPQDEVKPKKKGIKVSLRPETTSRKKSDVNISLSTTREKMSTGKSMSSKTIKETHTEIESKKRKTSTTVSPSTYKIYKADPIISPDVRTRKSSIETHVKKISNQTTTVKMSKAVSIKDGTLKNRHEKQSRQDLQIYKRDNDDKISAEISNTLVVARKLQSKIQDIIKNKVTINLSIPKLKYTKGKDTGELTLRKGSDTGELTLSRGIDTGELTLSRGSDTGESTSSKESEDEGNIVETAVKSAKKKKSCEESEVSPTIKDDVVLVSPKFLAAMKNKIDCEMGHKNDLLGCINIPEVLYYILEEDSEMFHADKIRLIKLPSVVSISEIMNEYKKSVADSGKRIQNEVSLFCENILEYIRQFMGQQFLYNREQKQYSKILQSLAGESIEEKRKCLPNVYGAIHLLRLFTKFHYFVFSPKWDLNAVTLMRQHVDYFLSFLEKNMSIFFSSEMYHGEVQDESIYSSTKS